jgi:hypothetical protein
MEGEPHLASGKRPAPLDATPVPPLKKAMMQVRARSLWHRPRLRCPDIFLDRHCFQAQSAQSAQSVPSAQPSTAHSAMSEKMLQRQNAALSSAKANLQRELDDTAAQVPEMRPIALHLRQQPRHTRRPWPPRPA